MGNIIATDSPPDEQAVPEQNVEEVDATNPDSIAYKLQQIKDIIEAQDIGDDVLLEKMESITSLSKYLWNKYNDLFLQPEFCNKIAVVISEKLADIDPDDLKQIHSYMNSGETNPKIGVYLKYDPAEKTNLIVDNLETDLIDYFENNNIQLNDRLTVKGHKYKEQYINRNIINSIKVNNRNKKKNNQRNNNEEILNQNNQYHNNINGGYNNNYNGDNNNGNGNLNNGNNNGNLNNGNLNNGNLNNGNNNGNLNNGNGNLNNGNDIPAEHPELEERELRKDINKLNQQQNNFRKSVKNAEKSIHSNNFNLPQNINKNNNNNNNNNKNNNRKNSNPCTGQKRCTLTKSQLCKEITKNYIVRSNIVAAILTAIPDNTNKEKNICYQELKAIEDCKICLPPSFDKLEEMNKDDRIVELLKYVSQLSEKKCLEVNGLYKQFTEEEKKNIHLNKDLNKYNAFYLKLTIQMKQQYHSSLIQLLEILKLLNTELVITNNELNLIGAKTKEILDTMYSNCQFNYLNAVWALIKADVSSHNEEESNANRQLSNSIQSSIDPIFEDMNIGNQQVNEGAEEGAEEGVE